MPEGTSSSPEFGSRDDGYSRHSVSKLEAMVEQTLALWRLESEDAQSGEHPELNAEAVAIREVPVIVTYEGDIAELQRAGLKTGFDRGGVVSGHIRIRDIEGLADVPEVVFIELESPVHLMLDDSVRELRVPWLVPPSDPWPGKGTGVIVAVIDTGIDIFHDSFRKADGKTRILELWDQAATTGGLPPPLGFQQVGRVYDADDIDAGIAAGAPFVSVDTNGHGTHVAGIAAGNGRQDDRCSFPGRYVGVAPEAHLVIAKAIALPAGSTAAVNDAMQWCAQAAIRHAGSKGVVVNCSFGSDLGPHDGTDPRDVFLDGLLSSISGPTTGVVFVVAAGNEGISQIHETGQVLGGNSATVSFTVPEGSRRVDTLDLWYNGTATLNVTITVPPNPAAPGQNTIGPILPGAPGSPFTLGQMRITVGSSTAPRPANNNKKRINIAILPLANTTVRSGPWQLTLTETAGVNANWDAWFATSKTDPFPTFRVSDDPVPARQRENTVGSPGTARNAITVASYDDDDGALAASSSRGQPAVPAGTPVGEFKPTVAAPGVGVASPRSRNDPKIQSSCCDQKVIDKSGTSMATPHVAGLVALMLEKNNTLTFEEIRRHLQHSTRIDGIPTAEVPPIFDAALNIRAGHLWGSGKVNAAAALAEMPAGGGGGGGGDGGGGGGGGGGGMITVEDSEWGYTPHTIFSRLGEWQARFGTRPGLMLVAALVSEHVDEVLRLINTNKKVATVWHRQGGPLLVRHLLYGRPDDTPLPTVVGGCDVSNLFRNFLPILSRFGSTRLQADIDRFGAFASSWPGADLERLDQEAARMTVPA
jgi:subtilisin family serine protease